MLQLASAAASQTRKLMIELIPYALSAISLLVAILSFAFKRTDKLDSRINKLESKTGQLDKELGVMTERVQNIVKSTDSLNDSLDRALIRLEKK